ncbi:type II secretion system F family protein [Dehalococcoides mccartyi]|uniref:Pilin biogenesis protein, putative n=1 Tax=Dehalococcoides mccartyi (strain ATCC BAA-2266 / KCTC 15142 / 195) TaxID=243164 RepID=Q3Z6T6_DEHM1|nr:type II secretion system F family protein [Dehalococcoides mccartyi]AAW39410.1 pilin biogenesis protein, putative [Dehalococcoides mccartyi 195]
MDFNYVAYGQDKRLVKGKIPATSLEAAQRLLSHSGYQILSIKPITPFFSTSGSFNFSKVKPREVILFSRQLALLLESGTDIVTSLELLQEQTTNKLFREIIGEIVNDIRGGSSLSLAMSKHPKAFPPLYHRVIAAGEQGGSLEVVLRNLANFVQRNVETEKKIKSALTYPSVVAVVGILVLLLMVTFVLPAFTSLYSQMGTELPAATRILIGISDFFGAWGLYVTGIFIATIAGLVIYLRTPAGRYQRDRIALKLPIIGRILLLSELSRACQTMSLLFKAGLPLPEIMNQTTAAANNKLISNALAEVQHDLIRGEGLSRPMTKNPLFLPMMVQMVSVGEETGKLDDTLATVSATYDTEADDRISSAIGMIQPVMTIAIGLIVGFIAVALVSSMYSLYGQIG